MFFIEFERPLSGKADVQILTLEFSLPNGRFQDQPGFDLLQDQLDYWSHTHHSNVDTVDHVLQQDLMISAAFLATLVYHAATREELMPREALPPPLPKPAPLPEILRD